MIAFKIAYVFVKCFMPSINLEQIIHRHINLAVGDIEQRGQYPMMLMARFTFQSF